MSQERSLIHQFASRYSIEPGRVLATLKHTAFKVPDERDGTVREVSDEEMIALLVIANEYGLNPFTKEIYAFPDKRGGIVPVVSVDGWVRIINKQPVMDGIEFSYSEKMTTVDQHHKPCPEWCEVTIYRNDRSRPIVVREYLDEVYQAPFVKRGSDYIHKGPWQTHTKRFLRHKALIQGARIAFGFGGIYDEDEAQRINDARVVDAEVIEHRPEVQTDQKKPEELPLYDDARFQDNLPAWKNIILEGSRTADQIIATVETRARLTEEQKALIYAPAPSDETSGESNAEG